MDRKRKIEEDEKRNNVKRRTEVRRSTSKFTLRTKKEFDRKDSKPRDRGDIKKDDKCKVTADSNTQVESVQPGDDGDSPERIVNPPEKPPEKPPERTPDINRLYRAKRTEKSFQRIFEKMSMEIKPLNYDMRKKLAERYTFRRIPENQVKQNNEKQNVNENNRLEISEDKQALGKLSTSSQASAITSDWSQTERIPREVEKKIEKKTIIKTIASRNDPTRVYKEVTFVERRKGPAMHINVSSAKRPRTPVSQKSKSPEKSPIRIKSKFVIPIKSVREKAISDRNQRMKRKRIPSPEITLGNRPSPVTEVARWAPACVTGYTKPYYEAWVNTTLAAISRNSRKDKMAYHEELIKTFQQILDEEVPTQVEKNVSSIDERQTGKIKVIHRQDRSHTGALASSRKYCIT